MLSTELAALFARDLKRLIQELGAFPDTSSLWQTVPGVTNAAGTLALHLEGNLREYIGRQLAATYPEQVLGVPITTRQFVIHLSGHLNYHLGQIDYLRRMTTGDGAINLVSL